MKHLEEFSHIIIPQLVSSKSFSLNNTNYLCGPILLQIVPIIYYFTVE